MKNSFDLLEKLSAFLAANPARLKDFQTGREGELENKGSFPQQRVIPASGGMTIFPGERIVPQASNPHNAGIVQGKDDGDVYNKRQKTPGSDFIEALGPKERLQLLQHLLSLFSTKPGGIFPPRLSFQRPVLSTGVPLSSLSMLSLLESLTSPDASKKLLCIYFTGRFGNELFQFASGLGLAMTMNRTAVFIGSHILPTVLKHFVSSTSYTEARCAMAKYVSEYNCCTYNDKLTMLDPSQDYEVGLYLQSYRYFDEHKSLIREAITFNDVIQQQTSLIVRHLRHLYRFRVLVGVHIRHGDMALDYNQKLGYPLASVEYIHRALDFYQQLYPRCVFVVASDSVDWCRDHFPGGFHVHYLTGNEAAVDMAILAALDHAVISFGTYSWWVGYLNQGKTVYMKDFIVPGSFVGKLFNPGGKDYIVPGWIPM